MSLELPDGVTFNQYADEELQVELPFETPVIWQCKKCNLSLEVLLIGENNRFQGQIRAAGTNTVTWKGPLPKAREKAVDFLSNMLQQKVVNHEMRH